MRISWNWLKTLCDVDLTPHKAADVLTSTGLEVESVEAIEPVKGMLAGVVVGHVLETRKHPGADRLTLCSVDLGAGEPAAIVCGAPNVAKGQKVFVATVGATLHMRDGGSLMIKKAKIRGEESNGMICAEDELGLGDSHAGIIVLDPSAVTGTPAAVQLGMRSDHALEIGLTPNRADAMSHLGVARDLVAALNVRTGSAHKVWQPSVEAFHVDDHALTIPVSVEAPHQCPRYAGVTLTQVKVGPSPAWLQDRLKAIGLKPINNVVDITNYVQHELGQPLHAFDAAQLKGGRIIVGGLPEGTVFVTLDGMEHKLASDDLMIRDAEGGACIAGVFGGLHSGVTEATTTIFLESACFDPGSVRRTARRHGLHTDASFRFERGVDPEMTVPALQRAALLMKEICGARISSDPIDILQHPVERTQLVMDLDALDRLAGQPIPAATVEAALRALDISVTAGGARTLNVAVPPYRVDVRRPADVAEEVLRIIGYDHIAIPDRLRTSSVRDRSHGQERAVRAMGDHFAACGYREILTPSLVNGALATSLHAFGEHQPVRLKNPLSAELDTLRPTLLFGGLAAIAHNVNRQMRDLRFFERGRTYGIAKGVVRETDRTALWATGARERENWRSGESALDALELKAELERLSDRMGIGRLTVQTAPHALLHEAVDLRSGDHLLAVLGEVSREVRKAFDVEQRVFYAELNDEAWTAALHARSVVHRELPKYPSVRRDLSLLIDEGVEFAQLEQVARKAERTLLRDVGLFDVYQGDKLPKGRKSYALRFILLDEEKTLTEEVVEKTMARIRSAFEKELGAELRG